MEDKQYQVDKMLDTLVELASNETEKAKQRGYFGKDFVEAAGIVISLVNDKQGVGGYGNSRGYGNYDRRGYGNSGYGNSNYDRGGYGGYDTHEGYGNSESYEGTGEYERRRGGRGTQGERYGRSGERYG